MRCVPVVASLLVHAVNGQTNPCAAGETFQCSDGSNPSPPNQGSPCPNGPPQCCNGGTCTEAPRPGGGPSQGGRPGGGAGGGAACDGTGSSATYAETIGTGNVGTRQITSSGCPNHYSLCTGKAGISGCAAIGSAGTATEAKEQSKSLTIPSSPVLRSSFGVGVSGSDVQCSLGPIAIALNGVSIYGGAVDQQCTSIDVDVISSEWSSFDCCGGHSQQQGDYHYHFAPGCLEKQIGELNGGHSPQIGWAYDGFPIYGPKGPGGVDMKYGGNLGPCTGAYCLDECGGVEQDLTAVDNFKYRYYLVGATSDLSTLPVNPKPSASAAAQFSNSRRSFSINCYRGYTYNELDSGQTGTSGVTSSYTASATSGIIEKFAPSGLCTGEGITSAAAASNGFCSDFTSSSCNAGYGGVGSSGSPTSSPTPSPTPSPSPGANTASQGFALSAKFVMLCLTWSVGLMSHL